MPLPINLNNYVTFKMKLRGVAVAREYWAKTKLDFPNSIMQVDEPDTKCRLQFHDLFRIFGGQHMEHHTDGCPFYDLKMENTCG